MRTFSTDTPCVISAALTGGFARRDQLPWLPCTPEEIATSAIECWRAGAAICHIHVRNPDGSLTHSKAMFEEIRDRVRAESDLNLNFTTSKTELMTQDDRFDVVHCGPELATFNSGSLNFGDLFLFENSPTFLRRMAMQMWKHQVRPEFECFDTGHIGNIKRLIAEGYFEPPYFFQLVMLPKGTMPPRPGLLLQLLDELPPESHWMAVGAGRDQLPMNAMGIVLGGHVRTGFEDNLYYRRGEKGKSNAQMVARVVRLCNEMNRPVASAAEARRIFKLRDVRDPTSRAYARPYPETAVGGPAGRFFAELPARLGGTTQPGLGASYQFFLRGEGGGDWWVTLENGRITAGPGEMKNPAVTLTGEASDWLKLAAGEIHPVGAIQTGQIVVSDGKFTAYGALIQALAAAKAVAAR